MQFGCKAENRYESRRPLTEVIFYLQPVQLPERIRRCGTPAAYAGSWCILPRDYHWGGRPGFNNDI